MASSTGSPLWLAYYADDFTGATDALERLELAGVRTALYMEPPSRELVAERPDVRAIGVAGVSRALPTDEILAEVLPAFQALRNVGAPHVHYKVCSTFDSSPEVGSIGRVIDVATEAFAGPFVPLIVGAPALGRWCVFGNLFAGMGIGTDGPAFRLDRHPSMKAHPSTPMDEADLRVHLSKQTSGEIALVDVRTLDLPADQASEVLNAMLQQARPDVVLFDTLTNEHLAKIGALVEPLGTAGQPLFWVGSSAVESALACQWSRNGKLGPPPAFDRAAIEGPVLVLAGSCSPITSRQIDRAAAAGMKCLTLGASEIRRGQAVSDSAVRQIIEHLQASRSVIVRTEPKTASDSLPASLLGQAFGQLSRQVLQRVRPDLLVVAGGDTASHTARTMPIECLEFEAPLATGAPVCRIVSADTNFDRLRIVFKGGQVGSPNFFASMLAPLEAEA